MEINCCLLMIEYGTTRVLFLTQLYSKFLYQVRPSKPSCLIFLLYMRVLFFKNPHVLRVLHFVRMIYCCSVANLCPTLCYPMDCRMPGFPVHHQLWSLLKLMSIGLMMPTKHLILCHPLLLLSSVFPSIRVFSNESALHIKWPSYWSFSFSISPPSEYSGLISFRVDWFDLLAVQGALKSLL